jgi:hypothetical protein
VLLLTVESGRFTGTHLDARCTLGQATRCWAGPPKP